MSIGDMVLYLFTAYLYKILEENVCNHPIDILPHEDLSIFMGNRLKTSN